MKGCSFHPYYYDYLDTAERRHQRQYSTPIWLANTRCQMWLRNDVAETTARLQLDYTMSCNNGSYASEDIQSWLKLKQSYFLRLNLAMCALDSHFLPILVDLHLKGAIKADGARLYYTHCGHWSLWWKLWNIYCFYQLGHSLKMF